MKSIAKVITQRHIKQIPVFMYGFRMNGIMSHGIVFNSSMSQKEKRASRKNNLRSQSRKANRG